MKTLIILLGIVLFQLTAFGQLNEIRERKEIKNEGSSSSEAVLPDQTRTLSTYDNRECLEKYWWYRYRLRRYFMYPFSTDPNKPDFDVDAKADLDPTVPGNYCMSDILTETSLTPRGYGDGMIKLGEYLAVLATEYHLLKTSGEDYTFTLEEIKGVLYTMKRLDINAEDYFRPSGPEHDIITYDGEDFNGFFLRMDIPEKIEKFGVGESLTNKLMDGWVTSQDQVWYAFLGFALVKKLVDDAEVINLTKQLAEKFYGGLWRKEDDDVICNIQNPESGVEVIGEWGGNTSGTLDAFHEATEFITDMELEPSLKKRLSSKLLFQLGLSKHVNTYLSLNDVTPGSNDDFYNKFYTWVNLGGNEYNTRGFLNLVAVGNIDYYVSDPEITAAINYLLMGNEDVTQFMFAAATSALFKKSAQEFLLQFAEDNRFEAHVLINYILHDGQQNLLPNASLYENLLKSAPECGPTTCFSNFTPQNQYLLNGLEDMVNANGAVLPCNEVWNSTDRMGKDAETEPLYLWGLDYLFLHNLYHIVYDPPSFDCFKDIDYNIPFSIDNGPPIGVADMPYILQSACKIEASSQISEYGDVSFTAGESIILTPGFKIAEGGHLTAVIEPLITNPGKYDFVSESFDNSKKDNCMGWIAEESRGLYGNADNPCFDNLSLVPINTTKQGNRERFPITPQHHEIKFTANGFLYYKIELYHYSTGVRMDQVEYAFENTLPKTFEYEYNFTSSDYVDINSFYILIIWYGNSEDFTECTLNKAYEVGPPFTMVTSSGLKNESQQDSFLVQNDILHFEDPFNKDDFFFIYPNPSKDYINFIIENIPLKEVYLINTYGKVVRKLSRDDIEQKKVYIEDLPQGSYFIKINSDHTSVVRKFIKL